MILISGAGGHIGRALIKKLSKKKDKELLALVYRHVKFPPKVRILTCDLTKPVKKNKIFSHVDTIIHLAAKIDYTSPKEKVIAQNTAMTNNIVKLAKRYKIKRIIYMSSASVYGHADNENIIEETSCHPESAYAYSKLLGEREIRKLPHWIIFRAPVIYGPGFESFCKLIRLIEKHRMFLIGNAKNNVAMVHVNDVVDAIIKVIENKKIDKQIFNIASDELISQEKMLKVIASELRVSLPAFYVSRELALGLATTYQKFEKFFGRKATPLHEYIEVLSADRIINIEKAKKILKFRPRVKFKEGVKELIRECKSSQH